jgi:hypothetical protein
MSSITKDSMLRNLSALDVIMGILTKFFSMYLFF